MKKKVILYPPTLDFSFLHQRPQHVCAQFARNGYQVIFCNNTQSDKPYEEIEPNLFVYHNFKEVLNLIKHKIIKVDIFYYTWAKSAEYIDDIRAKMNLYDSVDQFHEWQEYEDNAIVKADILLTSSKYLFDLRSPKHDRIHLVRNACPESYIHRDGVKPKDYEGLKGPIVLFSGAIGRWVDTSILRKVAEKYTVVLVGQEFGKKLPSNVVNLGVKNHDDLYNYYAFADVCLLPFNTELEVTQAACAVKQFEYMSAGKLTVATNWDETSIYPDSILVADTDEEFLKQVDLAIEMSKDEKYKYISLEYAKDNTWEKRFEIIEGAILNYSENAGDK